jgi:hypothetical protein
MRSDNSNPIGFDAFEADDDENVILSRGNHQSLENDKCFDKLHFRSAFDSSSDQISSKDKSEITAFKAFA